MNKRTPVFSAKTRVLNFVVPLYFIQRYLYYLSNYMKPLYLIYTVTGVFRQWLLLKQRFTFTSSLYSFHHCCSGTIFSSFTCCLLPPFQTLCMLLHYLLFSSSHFSYFSNSIIICKFCQPSMVHHQLKPLVPLALSTYFLFTFIFFIKIFNFCYN